MNPDKESKFDIKDLSAIAVFVLLVFLWFYHILFYKNILSYADLGRYFYPLREFAAESIKNGNVPLWNPYLKIGTPFLAMLQSCVFYPLSAICYASDSFETAFNWYIVMHFVLAAVFMYALSRHWNLSRIASYISALVFAFGGYLSSVIHMNTSLSSAVWLPAVFLFFDKALKKKSLRLAALASVFLGIQFLGGEPTIIYCTIWLMFFYYLHFILSRYRENKDLKEISLITGIFFISAALWIFIVMIQLLPFAELLIRSTRAGAGAFETVTRWSLSPVELFSFFVPFAFGNTTVPAGYLTSMQDWMVSFYIGIMSIILVFIAVFTRPDRRSVFFTATLIVSLLLAMGKYTPLYRIFYSYVFGFGHIRYPVKFLFLSSFALSFLSGKGYDVLMSVKDDDAVGGKISRILLLSGGLFGLLSVIFLKYWDIIYSHLVKLMVSGVLKATPPLKSAYIIFLISSSQLYRSYIVFACSIMAIVFLLYKRLRAPVFNLLALSIIFLDLLSVNMGITKFAPVELFKKEPASFAFVKKDSTFFRVLKDRDLIRINRGVWGYDYASGQYERKATFDGNTPMAYGIFDAQGYGSISRRDYVDFMDLIYTYDDPYDSKLIDLLNIKYIITSTPIRNRGYETVFKDKIAGLPIKDRDRIYEYFYINKNKRVFNRAFLVKDAKIVKNRQDALSLLQDKGFDPAETVILEREPRILKGLKKNKPVAEEAVSILSYRPEEVVIEAFVKEPKFLVLSDSFYPGWKAYVDGREVALYRADYLLRAVHLDSGHHNIIFRFSPLSYYAGKYITIITLCFLILIFAFPLLSGILNKKRENNKP